MEVERSAIPEEWKRVLVKRFFDLPHEAVHLDEVDVERARVLCQSGVKEFDAFHLAAAERGRCSALLTTDDRFIARAQRIRRRVDLEVMNPVDWVLGNLL